MTEVAEQHTASEHGELAATHMIDMSFDLPEQGIEYQALQGLTDTLAGFSESYGEELGLRSAVAQVDIPNSALRVVAHIDDANKADEAEIVDLLSGIVSDFGVSTSPRLSTDEALANGLSEAS